MKKLNSKWIKITTLFVTLVLLLNLIAPILSYAHENNVLEIQANEVVQFADPNLESAIRKELDIPNDRDITKEDMGRLEILKANGLKIKDLTGLESAVNLKGLYIGDNNISDITPLKNLTNLTSLSLWNNNISDIAPIKNLKNLEYLPFGVTIYLI